MASGAAARTGCSLLAGGSSALACGGSGLGSGFGAIDSAGFAVSSFGVELRRRRWIGLIGNRYQIDDDRFILLHRRLPERWQAQDSRDNDYQVQNQRIGEWTAHAFPALTRPAVLPRTKVWQMSQVAASTTPPS